MTHKVPDLPGVKGGGLDINFRQKGAIFDITSTPERQGLVGGIRDVLSEQAGEVGDLREEVRPGFGRLTEARVGAIDRARRRSIGNLRENLARRRVLGSSFGQDALTRANREFAQEEERARAQSFLEELQLQNELLTQQFDLRRQSFQTALDELNLQADFATRLAGGGASAISQNQAVQQQIQAEQRSQVGQFLGAGAGMVLGPGLEAIGSEVGNFVGGLFD